MPWWPVATAAGDSSRAIRIVGRRLPAGFDRSFEMRKLATAIGSERCVSKAKIDVLAEPTTSDALAPAAVGDARNILDDLDQDRLLIEPRSLASAPKHKTSRRAARPSRQTHHERHRRPALKHLLDRDCPVLSRRRAVGPLPRHLLEDELKDGRLAGLFAVVEDLQDEGRPDAKHGDERGKEGGTEDATDFQSRRAPVWNVSATPIATRSWTRSGCHRGACIGQLSEPRRAPAPKEEKRPMRRTLSSANSAVLQTTCVPYLSPASARSSGRSAP